MYRGHTIGVVVPAYNERAHVGEVLSTMPAFVDRVYAVDDCSSDGTWEIIQSYATADADADETDPTAVVDDRPTPSIADGGVPAGPEVVPIRHAENVGAGGALRTGYVRAGEDGVDVVATMDADGQMDPDQLSWLLDPIVEGEADYTKGNRLADRNDRREMPPFRLFGNWLLTQLTKIASGYWGLQDPQNGYTAISHGALAAVDVESLPDDHDYPNDLLVRLNVADMRVADVSMPAVYHDEESTIRYRTFVPTTSLTLLRGFLRRLKAQTLSGGARPAMLCYVAGIAGVATLGASGVLAATDSTTTGSTAWRLAGGAVGLLASVAILVVAVALDARKNATLEVRR